MNERGVSLFRYGGSLSIPAGTMAQQYFLMVAAGFMSRVGQEARENESLGAAMASLRDAFFQVNDVDAVFVRKGDKGIDVLAVIARPEAEEEVIRRYRGLLYEHLDVDFGLSVFYREDFPELEPPQGMNILFKRG